jgi:PD-(D/E)XK nuclease superfamily protein
MDETDYAFEDETYAVIGAAIEVLSQLGHGIHEKPYENALAVDWVRHQPICVNLRPSAVVLFPACRYAAFSSPWALFWLFDLSGVGNSFLTMGATRVPRSSMACIAFRCGITPPLRRIVILLMPPSTSFS